MKLFATPIDRTFIRFSYRPDHLSGTVRPSQTLSPTHQYWNTHLDQLFDLLKSRDTPIVSTDAFLRDIYPHRRKSVSSTF